MNDNELYHYGVLGMRWGVRREEKAAASGKKLSGFSARKAHTQEYNKAQKLHNKDIKRSARGKYTKYTSDILDVQKTTDSAVRSRVRHQNLAKSIAQQVLLGGHGSVIYNEKRAQGEGRRKALGASAKYAYAAHVRRLIGLVGAVLVSNAAYNSKSVSDFFSKAFAVETDHMIYNTTHNRFMHY